MFLLDNPLICVLFSIFSPICLIKSARIPPSILSTPRNSLINDSSRTTREVARRDGITDAEKERINQISNDYKGIYWIVAYPGAGSAKENGGCTFEQFNILAEATRMSVVLADFSGLDLLQEDAYWHRFFVRNSKAPPGGRWTSDGAYDAAYKYAHHNLLLPSRFSVNGKGSGGRRTRITYQCVDPTDPVPVNGGCAAGMPAYSQNAWYTGTGDLTVFCPKFFTGRYLNDITNGPTKRIGDFGSPDLISYEQMMVHEWMHADVMGISTHIEDISDSFSITDPTVYQIYGMSRCKDYAWKFMCDACNPHVNIQSVRNADNYAWYFANKYYAKHWGWTDDGSAQAAQNETTDSTIEWIGTPPPTIVASNLTNLTGDFNCTLSDNAADAINITMECDLDGPAPDDAVIIPISSASPTSSSSAAISVPTPPLTGSCNCNEDGCIVDSPDCCADGSCS